MGGHGNLRAHQAKALRLAQDIIEGTLKDRIITAAVTPGGGKTLMASIFAHALIDAGVVDKVCILVPRDSLRTQFVSGFTDLERHLPRVVIAEGNKSLGQARIFRDSGYVTTVQALVRGVKRHLRRFVGARWLLIIDEPHHLAERERDSWVTAVRQLVDASTFVLLMSGTLYRHDGRRIPFVEYDEDRKPRKHIEYTRRHALEEEAVLPITVRMTDGQARYWRAFDRHDVRLSEAPDSEQPAALRTLLIDAAYRNELVDAAVKEWFGYRSTVYRSRMIVLADRQDRARSIAKHIREAHKVEVALATSDEKGAARTLRKFRDGALGEVLVTVGMAYEGLDVPDCTHLVCLTDIRSRPWLEQAFARVTRFNAACGVPYPEQRAFLYVPDDPRMAAFLRESLAEQDERFKDDPEPGEGRGAEPRTSSYAPIDATKLDDRYCDQDVIFTREESELITLAKKEFPGAASWPARELLRLGRSLAGSKAAE